MSDIDELSPEEVLQWIEERKRARVERLGWKGHIEITDPEERLIESKIYVAETEARIAILKKELANLVPGRLNSMDEEIRIRAEIAEMEGWRAKMQGFVKDNEARIVRDKAKAKKE